MSTCLKSGCVVVRGCRSLDNDPRRHRIIRALLLGSRHIPWLRGSPLDDRRLAGGILRTTVGSSLAQWPVGTGRVAVGRVKAASRHPERITARLCDLSSNRSQCGESEDRPPYDGSQQGHFEQPLVYSRKNRPERDQSHKQPGKQLRGEAVLGKKLIAAYLTSDQEHCSDDRQNGGRAAGPNRPSSPWVT